MSAAPDRSGRIEHPQRGDRVWLFVNERAEARYFAEPYLTGVRLAFDPELSQVVYYPHAAGGLYRSKSELLRMRCQGLERAVQEAQRSLEAERAELLSAIAAEAAQPILPAA
jgi:hypothetical protein